MRRWREARLWSGRKREGSMRWVLRGTHSGDKNRLKPDTGSENDGRSDVNDSF